MSTPLPVSVETIHEARDILDAVLIRADVPEEVRADVQKAQDRIMSYISAIAILSLHGCPGAGESPMGSRPAGM